MSIMTGTLWPHQGFPWVMMKITSLLPSSHAVSSMQSLLISDLSILSPQVMSGFIAEVIYILVMIVIIMCMIIVKLR